MAKLAYQALSEKKAEDIRIIDNEKNEVSVQAGETILLPAATQEVTIVPEGAVKLLETYV